MSARNSDSKSSHSDCSTDSTRNGRRPASTAASTRSGSDTQSAADVSGHIRARSASDGSRAHTASPNSSRPPGFTSSASAATASGPVPNACAAPMHTTRSAGSVHASPRYSTNSTRSAIPRRAAPARPRSSSSTSESTPTARAPGTRSATRWSSSPHPHPMSRIVSGANDAHSATCRSKRHAAMGELQSRWPYRDGPS
nr:hypothetical protein [Glycomyces sambucus]